MKIYAPELLSGDNRSVIVRSLVEYVGGSDYLWYSVDRAYGEFLVTENSDAFLLAVLTTAMKHRENLYLEAPVSEKLFYNLKHHYSKIQALTTPTLRQVEILPSALNSAPLNPTVNGVATGFSGGVDSFCVLADHFFGNPTPNYKVTHFVCNNVGAFGSAGRKLFYERSQELAKYSKQYDIPFLKIDSNLHDFLKGNELGFMRSHVYRNTSAILTLQKLLSKYLYASAYEYSDCGIIVTDSAAYSDPLTLHLLSTETTECISTGCQYSRTKKTEKVAVLPSSYEYLNVCMRNSGVGNCSTCYKCLRTLVTLEVLGKLNLYERVFSLQQYREVRHEYISKLLRDRGTFEQDIVHFAQQHNYSFPLWCRILPPWFFSATCAVKQQARRIANKIIPMSLRKFLKALLQKT
jgi:hypothetical protein